MFEENAGVVGFMKRVGGLPKADQIGQRVGDRPVGVQIVVGQGAVAGRES